MEQKELIEFIAKSLADEPEKVVVEEVESRQGTTLRLIVSPEDLGKVIGKQGRTVRAIRTLMYAISIKNKKRVFLEIPE